MVADDGLVRLPERSCDKYGADIVMPSALSAAITSAEVCAPLPGGYTVSNRRFRRAANVVLIDMTSTGALRSNGYLWYLLIMVATLVSNNQVQTRSDSVPKCGATAEDAPEEHPNESPRCPEFDRISQVIPRIAGLKLSGDWSHAGSA